MSVTEPDRRALDGTDLSGGHGDEFWNWVSSITGAVNDFSVGGFGGEIHVSPLGGDYDNIGDALAAASSGDTVIVHKGIYAENITIPSGVRVVGFPAAQQVIISGANTTDTRVTMSDTSTLRELTVVAPSSGSAPAIDCSGLGAGELAVIGNIVVQGAGGSGPLILGAGAGIVAFVLGFYHNGGNTTGAFMEFTSGSIQGACEIVANAGVVADILKISGTAAVEMSRIMVQSSALYTATDGIDIGGGFLSIGGFQVPQNATPLTNALHISGDGIELDASTCHFHGGTWDLLVDGGLVGTGTNITWQACDIRVERESAPAVWLATANRTGPIVDVGDNDDRAMRSIGEFAVGLPENGSETSLGKGDSTTRGMLVYTDDGTGTNFVDETSDAKSLDNPTFTTQGTATGEATLYVGTTLGVKPTDYRLNIDTAAVLGSGAYVAEVWTGASWDNIYFMMIDGDGYGATSIATALFEASANGSIRIDTESTAWANWAANDPGMGESALWIRFRNTGAITSGAVFDRIKTGFDRTEFNSDGDSDAKGKAEKRRPFWKGNGESLSAPQGGVNVPTDLDVTLSTNVTYRQARSSYASGSDRSAGTQLVVPEDIDTSRPLKLKMVWKTDGTSTVAVRWDLYVTEVPEGAVLNSTTTEKPVITKNTAPPGVANETLTTEFEVHLEGLVPGDEFGFTLWRKGATDTNPDAAGVLSLEWSGALWK